jgi:polyisoprenoid-binding protein YceI
VGYIHVTAFTGTTGVVKIQHSANDSTWADLITFTTISAVTQERVAVTGTVGFIGSKVTASHEGAFSTWNGGVVLAEGKVSAFRFEVDVATLKTDSEKLDGHLKSADFFDVEKFPKATFTSTEIKVEGEKATITGNLNLHGVEKSISFPATVKLGGDSVSATAEFSINRKDFGVVYAGKPDDLIRDEVLIKLTIAGKRG